VQARTRQRTDSAQANADLGGERVVAQRLVGPREEVVDAAGGHSACAADVSIRPIRVLSSTWARIPSASATASVAHCARHSTARATQAHVEPAQIASRRRANGRHREFARVIAAHARHHLGGRDQDRGALPVAGRGGRQRVRRGDVRLPGH